MVSGQAEGDPAKPGIGDVAGCLGSCGLGDDGFAVADDDVLAGERL
jgi:hypothetical protein